MKRTERLELIRRKLTKRRDEIFKTHIRAEDDRRSLMEPEVEFEETAQNESIADVLTQLDEREKEEIEAIDQALAGINLGTYGRCDVCGKPIAVKRLAAVPWTLLCTIHAKQQVMPVTPTAKTTIRLPQEYEGRPGREPGEIIADELIEDGDIELDQLKISVHAGQLHLEGFLPTGAQRRRLLEIVQDHPEFGKIVDEIIVNRAPWESEDYAPGTREIEDILEELDAEESEAEQETIASPDAGSLHVPPDSHVDEER